MSDPIQEFMAAMEAAGLTAPDAIEANGKLHRFDADGRKGKRTGWYTLHLDGLPAGSFGCWRTLPEGSSWCSKSRDAMSEAERQAYRQRMADMQRQREQDAQARHVEAKAECAKLWAAAKPCRAGDHPYLTRKGVKPYGLKVLGRDDAARLLVPLRMGAELVSLQFIGADGQKRFKTGGQVQGAYCAIGKPQGAASVLIVCEGYATGASLHECAGHAVAVAFNAGNLKAVAQALRQRLPEAKIIIAADDDNNTEGNPGLTKAREAAQAVGGLLAVPDFGGNRPNGATDFNDLHQLAGAAAVLRCIEAAGPVSSPSSAQSTAQDGQDGAVVLVNGSELKSEPVRWLWKDWLARGKLHLLAGAPGQGKTTLALAFGATVTAGGRWPDGRACPGGNILIWSGEDDPSDTLMPRLLAMGANPAKCYFVSGKRTSGGEIVPFDPASDMQGLERQAQVIGGVRLLIVDPVVSAVAGDSHKNAEVRRGLQGLVDLGLRLDAAVVGITHLSKGGAGADPTSRVIGSTAFSAVARVVMLAAKVKNSEGSERRVLVRSKSNIGPDDGGFEYEIEQAEPIPGIWASRITWGSGIDGTALELLADPEPENDDGLQDDAEQMLRAELSHGDLVPSEVVYKSLLAVGFTKKQIWKASQRVGVLRKKGGMGNGWYWRLDTGVPPEDSSKIPKIPYFGNVESSESSAESSTGDQSPTEDAEVF